MFIGTKNHLVQHIAFRIERRSNVSQVVSDAQTTLHVLAQGT
jgi:hypothetical protein